jgi:hypothetical protein
MTWPLAVPVRPVLPVLQPPGQLALPQCLLQLVELVLVLVLLLRLLLPLLL